MTDITPSRRPVESDEGNSEIALEAHLHEKLVQGKMRLHVTVVEEAAAFQHLLAGSVV